MAAGLGYKEFTTGDVLTAADANGYLASQVVMVFADAAARTTAITSPQEGMISYLKDTNVTQYYSGSAWINVGGSSPLTTKGDLYTYSTTDARLGVGTNGQILKANSSAATGLEWGAGSALTKIASASFTTQSSIVVDDCFTTSYKNYVLMWRMYGSSSGATLRFQYRTSAPATYADEYYGAFFSYGRNNSLTTAGFIDATFATISNYLSGTDFFSSGNLNITGVGNATERPNTFGQNLQEFNGTSAVHASYNNTTGNYKGFVLSPSTGTITGFYALYGMEI